MCWIRCDAGACSPNAPGSIEGKRGIYVPGFQNGAKLKKINAVSVENLGVAGRSEMLWAYYYIVMLALTAYREARGEGKDGMLAVMCVIRNRVNAKWGDWDHVITQKWQFSSITAPGDGQLVVWPDSPNAVFELAMQLAQGVYDGTTADITGGALFYFNRKTTPANSSFWKTVANNPTYHISATIGSHEFFATVKTSVNTYM